MDNRLRIDNFLSLLFQFGVLFLAIGTPLVFWNLTTEFYEIPKFLFVAALTGILIVVWAIRFVAAGRVSITKTPLDIPFLLLIIVFIISTFFAVSKWVAIYGNAPRIHGGLATFTVFVLLYFVLSSNLKSVGLVKRLGYLLMTSAVVLSVLSLASYAGIQLIQLPFTKGLNFTPTGSSFSTSAFLAILLPFPLMSILIDENTKAKYPYKMMMLGFLTLWSITILLIGSLPAYVASVVAIALAFFATPIGNIKRNIGFFIIPVVIVGALALFSFVKIGDGSNPLYKQAQSFPREIQLPFSVSWKVAVSAFRDSPLWGTGPGSFLADFTLYKPLNFNQNTFWNVRFDQPHNEYLLYLATLGGVGIVSLLLLTVMFISKALRSLSKSDNSFNLALAASGILFFVILALHPSTLVIMVIGLLILAMFMAAHKQYTEELHFGIAATRNEGNQIYLRFDALPIILMVLILILVGTGFYFVGRAALGDFEHRNALKSVGANKALDAYNQLISAEKANPYIDLYHVDLANTNFAIANAIATAKGPTEASPAGSLTDQDKKNIQQLLTQSINEARVAVALNPNNPTNWEVLGAIYRQITGVAQNALAFSLDSYGRAVQKDPLNPTLRLNIGGIYYSAKNYDMAIRLFSDAINLKSDYANAYFNLAIALRDKGDFKNAQAAAERVSSLVDPSSKDHEIATKLLSELKDKVNSNVAGAATSSAELNPASKTDSSLDNKNLPKVLDLPKPENIATPPAVKKSTTKQ